MQIDDKLQAAISGRVTKAEVDAELLDDLEQSGTT